jgi:hypothetical protein
LLHCLASPAVGARIGELPDEIKKVSLHLLGGPFLGVMTDGWSAAHSYLINMPYLVNVDK